MHRCPGTNAEVRTPIESFVRGLVENFCFTEGSFCGAVGNGLTEGGGNCHGLRLSIVGQRSGLVSYAACVWDFIVSDMPLQQIVHGMVRVWDGGAGAVHNDIPP